MNTAEVLTKALERIKAEKSWAKGWFAFDAAGLATCSRDPSACRWCARGALDLVCADSKTRNSARRALAVFMGGCIAGFNDHPATTHADVVAAFERAIQAEGGKQ